MQDIKEIAKGLVFYQVKKQKKRYGFSASSIGMEAFTYAICDRECSVTTITHSGIETTNKALDGDIIMCGSSKERYVLKLSKFLKLYIEDKDKDVYPEQSYRTVALYDKVDEINFIAPWGESMVLKPGDYLVKESDEDKYYRIGKFEFEETYCKLGE